MLKETLIQIFKRDIERLKQEISAYPDEATLWKIDKGISNSGGNLCLHLIGNLNHFIGADLDNTGYVRNRENEFAAKNIPKADLLVEIEKASVMVETALARLKEEDFDKVYEAQPQKTATLGFFMVHLVAHLSYHLGQINYHRRLLSA